MNQTVEKRSEILTNEGISAAAFTDPDNIRPKVGGGVNDFETTILATWSRRSIAYRDRGRVRKEEKEEKGKEREKGERGRKQERRREGGREEKETGRSRREQPRRRMRSVKQRDAANDAGRCNFVRK